MSSANVKAIEALETMRTALLQFKSDALSSLDAMQVESRRTIEWLQGRQQYWHIELQRRLEALRQAQLALARCQQAAEGDGRSVDCSREAAMVQIAQRAVYEAEQQLRNVQFHLKRVNKAYEQFQREARRLANILESELLHGTALLERSAASLLTYASISSSGNSLGTGNGSGVNVPSSFSAIKVDAIGAFSILDWSNYPSSLPRPQGPFKLLSDNEYKIARGLGNAGARAYHNAHSPEAQDRDVHHIHPIKFGGDPVDPSNLIFLTQKEHALYTTWWRRIQAQLEAGGIVY